MSDIRRFFNKNFFKKRKLDDTNDSQPTTTVSSPSPSTSHDQDTIGPENTTDKTFLNVHLNRLDIGMYTDSTILVDDELRLKLLEEPWTPNQTYDFKKDGNSEAKRLFRLEWLKTYPWLAYSAIAKGPFCRVCVLFRPPVHRGLQGQFILHPCLKYHKFNEVAQSHAKSQWHINVTASSIHFQNVMKKQQLGINEVLDTAYHRKIEENRDKLRSITSTVLFIAQHELPLRGKNDEGSVFTDMLHFRVESGDQVLKNHLESGPKNALYISHQIQNELIQSCADVLKEQIICEVKRASVFSVLADETADISGVEQLSIGIRYLRRDEGTKQLKLCEEFLGYTPLKKLDAVSIAETIIQFLNDCSFDLSRLVGQGYDGCSAMAGKEGGVQKLIRDKYPKAIYFHCASHILNLVINDLNNVKEVRNAIGTTKEIINFFRESTLRRSLIPNIPLFCETRWSAKYKSIRIFSDNFLVIVQALEKLTDDSGNKNTKIKAHLLLTAATTSTYILTLLVIATYSAKLEPVCNQLQQVNMNIKDVNAYVIKLTDLLQSHRDNACEEFSVIFKKAQSICQDLNVELKQSRLTARQAHRSNIPSENAEEYFRRSIFIPYLDSIISSLRTRFSCTQGKAFSLLQLHPQDMNKLDKVSFLNVVENINNLYGDILPNFTAEATTWYEMWKNKEITNKIPNCMTLIDEATTFYPAVSEALKIGMTLPATTCSIERSFSTLRRVKIWNRSTMSDERLSGLCMLSVHNKRVNDCPKFIDKVVDKFGQQKRRVALLF
jgi:Domain of unknown function (DUF4371)/hAT family C-terminal dimerisation region